MIKHIVFDLGGVLATAKSTILQDVLDSMTVTDHSLLNRIWTEYRVPAMNGQSNSRAFIQAVVESQPETTNFSLLYEQWATGYQTQMEGLNQELIKFIDNHRSRYVLSLLSDIYDVHVDYFGKETDIFNHFDHVFLSTELGITKAEGKEIFKIVAQNLKTTPSSILFIDDVDTNIQAAKKAGYNTILYTDNQSLWSQLISYGINK